MLCFDQKRQTKGETYITPIIFAKGHRKSDVSENSKFIMVNFCEMGFKKILLLVQLPKVDEMYNILKSASCCLLLER